MNNTYGTMSCIIPMDYIKANFSEMYDLINDNIDDFMEWFFEATTITFPYFMIKCEENNDIIISIADAINDMSKKFHEMGLEIELSTDTFEANFDVETDNDDFDDGWYVNCTNAFTMNPIFNQVGGKMLFGVFFD